MNSKLEITAKLAQKLIEEQFASLAHLDITAVQFQGHDNRTFRLGTKMLIRMPTAKNYAITVQKEQILLPFLAKHLTTISIPTPLQTGHPSSDYPFPFSIYKWMDGDSANSLDLDDNSLESIATGLAAFIKELHQIDTKIGPKPGQHNWWRGDHVSVYDKAAKEQITILSGILCADKAMQLWQKACLTKWQKPPIWVHGDIAAGNILIKDNKLSAIIDFGGLGVGDPACDLVIAWTLFKNSSREIFIEQVALDDDTWLRAKAWALWKATFELCGIYNKSSVAALQQLNIILN